MFGACIENVKLFRFEQLILAGTVGLLATAPVALHVYRGFGEDGAWFFVGGGEIARPLFLVWQPAVAMVFGYALSRHVPERPLEPPIPALRAAFARLARWARHLTRATG